MLIPIICFFAVCAACAVLLWAAVKKYRSFTSRTLCAALAFLVLSTSAEVFIFNINFFRSVGYEPFSLSEYSNDAASGYSLNDNKGSLVFAGIDSPIHNLCIKTSGDADVYDVTVYFTDEANSVYRSTEKRTLLASGGSAYLNLNLSGNCSGLMLAFSQGFGAIEVQDVTANANRPLTFNTLRMLAVFFALIFVWLFMPKSPLYRKKYVKSGSLIRSIMPSLIIVQTVVIFVLVFMNPAFVGIATKGYNESRWDGKGIDLIELPWEHHMQYYDLAKSLADGKLYLEDEVPQSLQALEDPYDYTARSSAEKISGDSYRWDSAYFNGKYYVYFGIVPELLLYLPCYLLTGAPFPSCVAVGIFVSLAAAGIYMLLSQIIKKYYRSASVGAYLLFGIGFVNCSGLLFLAKRPDFYSVPIAAGIAFAVWGLAFWLMSFNTESSKKQMLYCFLGSACSALVAGCRPQLVLVSFAAVPLFCGKLFKDKYLLTLKGVINLAVLAAPFIAVAAGLMYYNYARFGSPVDFGAAYNLTISNVNARNMDAGRVGSALFTYLFQPPALTAVFPFLESVNIRSNYIGTNVFEYCFGGIITSTPLLWSLFAGGGLFKELKQHKTALLFALFAALGVILAVADAEAGGLLQRYFSDFGFVLFIAAAFVVFAAEEKYAESSFGEGCRRLLLCGTVLSGIYTLLLIFSKADVTIDSQSPLVYQSISNAVQFWL